MASAKNSPNQLENLFSDSRIQTFAKHEVIIRSGDSPQGIYFLEKGFVKMNSVLKNGREITLNIFKPGSYFPLMWAISNLPNTYNFQAMTPTWIRRLPKETFLNYIHSRPESLFDLTNRLLIGINGLIFDINHILSGDSYHRIIAAILMFAKRFGTDTATGKTIITIPLTHQDLADVAAITRETASIHLKKLEKLHLISKKSHFLTIPDLQKLEIESEVDNAELSTSPST